MTVKKAKIQKISLLLAFVLISYFAFPQQPINPVSSDSELEIGIVEHLDTFLPDSILLINENGEKVLLEDVIDKP